jgi:hypothetical protein
MLAFMGKGDCSVCSAPAEVFAAVNNALRKKEKLRDIEARAGFSRSALHRHSKNCLPKLILAEHKALTFNPKNGREVVSWPNGTFTVHGKPIREENLLPDDLLIRVTYESTPIGLLGNPRAVPFDDRTAESFFDATLAEDAERAKARTTPN